MVLGNLAPTDFLNSYSYQRGFREPHSTEGRCGTARWPLYRQGVALPSFSTILTQSKTGDRLFNAAPNQSGIKLASSTVILSNLLSLVF